MRRLLLLSALTCTSLFPGACTRDVARPEESGLDSLTDREAVHLSSAFLAEGAAGGQGTGLHGGGASSAAAPARPCAAGGKVQVAGPVSAEFDPQRATGRVRADLTLAHQGCAYPVGPEGVIEITADPGVTLRITAELAADRLAAFRMEEAGGFAWRRSDGSSGRCTLDVTAAADPEGGSLALSGTFCGRSLRGTLDAPVVE